MDITRLRVCGSRFTKYLPINHDDLVLEKNAFAFWPIDFNYLSISFHNFLGFFQIICILQAQKMSFHSFIHEQITPIDRYVNCVSVCVGADPEKQVCLNPTPIPEAHKNIYMHLNEINILQAELGFELVSCQIMISEGGRQGLCVYVHVCVCACVYACVWCSWNKYKTHSR